MQRTINKLTHNSIFSGLAKSLKTAAQIVF